jgi:hypothetical protein
MNPKQLEKLGFEFVSTGGGCYSWSLQHPCGLTLNIEGWRKWGEALPLFNKKSVDLCERISLANVDDHGGLVHNISRPLRNAAQVRAMVRIFHAPLTGLKFPARSLERELAIGLLAYAWSELDVNEPADRLE